eukprot:symbB.v1.2.019174.t1/scaffold1559.1/size111769/7
MRRQARVDWEPESVLRQIGAEKLSQANKLSRAAMYMHHITAPWKQKFIREAAKRAGLSGICVFGKPGRILVEGPLEMVASYTARIKSWPWKRCDLEGPWMVDGGRAFDGFREINKGSFKKEAHLAVPFATTTGSAVAQITQPPWYHCLSQPKEEQAVQNQLLLASAAVLVSEDMAIRVYSAKSKALLSTLPPPPNSKVQVLEVFLCPVWQLLILWLSSEEVAIFYVPSAPLEKQSKAEEKVPRNRAATPLLLRRFGIVEVRTLMLDKDLAREAFCSVSIYYGPLPKGDTLMHTVKVAQQILADDSSPASPRRHMPRQTPPSGSHSQLSIFEVATISCNRIKACQDFERLPRCSGLKTVQAAMALIAAPLVQAPAPTAPAVGHARSKGFQSRVAVGTVGTPGTPTASVLGAFGCYALTRRRHKVLKASADEPEKAEDLPLFGNSGKDYARRRKVINHDDATASTSRLKRWWKKNAKLDAKAIRKMGLMCLLSYGFVSNVNALMLLLLATYRSILATGQSPLTSKAALKQFGITWAGLYVISNIIRPVRISIALAISKPIDGLVKRLEEKLKCKRWMAIGTVMLFLNVFLTIAMLWGGMMLVSTLTGVQVNASQFGVLLKAGKAHAKAQRDWYLLVGTRQGTLQAFSIAELLSDLPVWSRICGHLPKEATAPFSRRARRTRTTGKLKVPEENDARLAEIEQEHIEAMEESRAAGQRPFPKQSQIPLFSRWRRHDYAIEVVKSVADRILTIDTKRNLKVCRAEDSRCLFSFQLPDFSCLTPYLSFAQVNGQTGGQEDFSLLGVTLGNTRGALELVELPLDDEEPEVLSSHASHGGAVLQVDFLLPAEILVSVGQDDTLRFWSSSLHVLREVYFPQACTSVAFLQLPDMDTTQGHGDVLVGFAAHVEQIPLDVWARGVKHDSLGGTLDSTLRSSQGTSKGTSKGTQFSRSAQEEDSTALEELALMWEAPEAATQSIEEEVSLHEEPVEKTKTGMVMDFRGPPVIPLGVLSSSAADMTGVQERLEKRLAEPPLEHEHSKVLDQGDFQSVTRHYPGYYDWTVLPTDLIDAPRSYAIRGVTKDDNVAVVTSVGVGHLRNTGFQQRMEPQVQGDELAEEARTVEAIEIEEERETPLGLVPEKPPASRSGKPQPADASQSRAQPQDLACTRRPSSGEVKSPDQGDDSEEEQIEVEEEEVEETWRNLRIARGVPKRADAPKPIAQNIGNTDADVARMLKERGRLIDAPEDSYDSNFLSRVTAKKTDFVYCGVDNFNYARRPARRCFIPDSDIPDEGLKLWTATGRLRTGLRGPPQRALPQSYVPLPPPHLWERAPVTRSEVTEMSIIAAAQQPPMKNWAQDFEAIHRH